MKKQHFDIKLFVKGNMEQDALQGHRYCFLLDGGYGVYSIL